MSIGKDEKKQLQANLKHWKVVLNKKRTDPALVILAVVESVEARCMAADGPVTPTLQEMTEGELSILWRAALAIADGARK